jgi:CDP-glycerol glycerophosphotransferase
VPDPRVPLLSVVVPVHRVERYLAECLDSILAGAGDQVEVVAVDDASPDSCGALLDGYARRDPRVRVVHLATNVGLGRARNAGLDRATGEYVWFVDSDDRLPAAAVPAVAGALRRTRPDVLLVGHARLHPDGRVASPPEAALPVLPGPVRLVDRPDLLARPLATSACTMLVRREFLAGTGLRFPPGWYEDCAYAHPLLLAAERIGTLDRVCYHYRERDDGAITRSVSGRHFDIFDQYDRMWARLAAAPGHVALRPELFRRMIDHLLVVAGNEHRLPPGQRRAFFDRIVAQYRRRLPDQGYPVPGGVTGLKHRLVRRNAYLGYAGLRLLWRAVGARQRPAGPAGAAPAAQPASLPAR